MTAEVMDGTAVRHWCRLSVRALGGVRATIDALNVFPVPDSDTGTNLHVTLIAAADAVEALPRGAPSAEVWQAAARGALLGACGNSGIIVSQLLRGLADVCAPESRCDGLASLLHGAGALVLRSQDGTGPAAAALAEAIRQAGRHVAVIPDADRVASLAAAAAARLRPEGIEVAVIPARFPLQAIAGLAVHDPQRGFDADVAAMSQAAAGMRCGSVVGSGSDGGFAGLDGDEVSVTAQAQADVATALAARLVAAGGELVTLMEGAGAEPGLARCVADRVGQLRPGAEIVCYGGGPVPLLIGVE